MFLVVHISAFAVGGADSENIFAVTEIAVGHAAHVFGVVPVLVNAFHLIGIDDLVGADIIHSCIFDGNVAAVVYGDRVAFHQLVLYFDAGDMHRRGGVGMVDEGGIE